MSSDDLIPPQRLLTMQIIAAALPTGLLIFLGIVLFLVYGQANAAPPPQQNMPLLTLMAGGFLVITGALSFIVPHLVVQNGVKQIAAGDGTHDVNALLGLRQTTMIIGLALLEGPAFFGLIALLVERQPLAFVVPGLGLAGMLLRFPTASGVRNWMELQGRRVLELRADRR